MRTPEPCRVCGVGLLCDYRLCKPCSGGALKQRLYRKQEKAKKQFERVLLELKERNTPVRETHLLITQGTMSSSIQERLEEELAKIDPAVLRYFDELLAESPPAVRKVV